MLANVSDSVATVEALGGESTLCSTVNALSATSKPVMMPSNGSATLTALHTELLGLLPHRDKLELISAHQIAQKRSINLLEAALQFRPFESAQPIKLTQVIDKYLAKKAAESLRALSLKQIHWKLSLLTRAFPNESPNNLAPSHLEAWITARNWSRSTIDGVIGKIGPFFTWCVREGYCENNPCEAVKRPRSEINLQQSLDRTKLKNFSTCS